MNSEKRDRADDPVPIICKEEGMRNLLALVSLAMVFAFSGSSHGVTTDVLNENIRVADSVAAMAVSKSAPLTHHQGPSEKG